MEAEREQWHECSGLVPSVDSKTNVGWFCCWLLSLLEHHEVLIPVLRFTPLLINQHFQISVWSGECYQWAGALHWIDRLFIYCLPKRIQCYIITRYMKLHSNNKKRNIEVMQFSNNKYKSWKARRPTRLLRGRSPHIILIQSKYDKICHLQTFP